MCNLDKVEVDRGLWPQMGPLSNKVDKLTHFFLVPPQFSRELKLWSNHATKILN